MKKALLAALATAAIFAGTASADAPQGKLFGAALGLTVLSPVIDGGTTDVGMGNDLSGACTNDFGLFSFAGLPALVACSHFVASSGGFNAGSPKMRFAFLLPPAGPYAVVRIVDNAQATDTTDTVYFGFAATLPEATAWVNTGLVGSGVAGTWSKYPLLGDFTVQADQT